MLRQERHSSPGLNRIVQTDHRPVDFEEYMSNMATPPPLPPRKHPAQSPSPLSAPKHREDGLQTPSVLGAGYSTNLDDSDPRTSSSQSLIAPAKDTDTRRSLLVIYIHGFYGNDQSFRSFPAHVHALLTELLSETHIVHSKIYPRYKTYRAIHVARDNFSTWLQPHESTTTDVILVGHSMGGLLSAEVVLLPNHEPHLLQPFKHRILGILSLDSPFLGLHPGIVVSGLSSLFQPAPKPEKETMGSESESSLGADQSTSDLQLPVSDAASNASGASPPPTRPNELYDPPFFNDVPFREKPFLSRLRHFASKHKAEGIFNAIGNHVVSHLEFGGCMADYPELSSRYKRVRALEDVDELKLISDGHPAAAHRRVRFVNYYTLSPGRLKPPPPVDGDAVTAPLTTLNLENSEACGNKIGAVKAEINSESSPETEEEPNTHQEAAQTVFDEEDLYSADEPRPQPEEKVATEKPMKDNGIDDDQYSQDERRRSILYLDPVPILEEEQGDPVTPPAVAVQPDAETQAGLHLAPIPSEPEEPPLPDLTKYTDKDARKQAEREAKRAAKAYQQAVKDRNKAIREREKLLERRRKKSEKEAQRVEKQSIVEAQEAHRRDADKAMVVAEHATADRATVTTADRNSGGARKSPLERPTKLRKFCALPGTRNGRRDPTWVEVYMADVDEVGAHCGLFAPGTHYDRLVGDVGSRVVAWVHEDMSTRAAMEIL